jgi:predicted alpha/beta-hydrolase family hydrolase
VEESRVEVPAVTEEGSTLGLVSVSVARNPRSSTVAVIAHGAGGTMNSPAIKGLQRRLAESVTSVRFNFVYSERRKRSPDRQAALVACWRSVAEWVRKELEPEKLFLGGRSMGGRMASYLVAEGYPCAGLYFVAYPLHPPGRPDQQRKDHLAAIDAPMLFVSGTNDSFARRELLEPVAASLGARLHLIEGADHGFKVPKKLGRTTEEIEDEVARVVLAFVDSAGS